MADEKLDVPKALATLNEALRLQHRSALQYSLTSAGVSGFDALAISDRLWDFATAELADARLLVEKIAALGGEPTTEVAALRFSDEAGAAIDWLIEVEEETIEALHKVIPHTGQEGRSEALEHLMEHLIMRKQNQVDLLTRMRKETG